MDVAGPRGGPVHGEARSMGRPAMSQESPLGGVPEEVWWGGNFNSHLGNLNLKIPP